MAAGGSLITRLYDFFDGMIVHEFHLDQEYDNIHLLLNGLLGNVNIASDADIHGSKLAVGTIPLDRMAFDLATQAELNTHKSSADHDGRYYTEAEIDAKLWDITQGEIGDGNIPDGAIPLAKLQKKVLTADGSVPVGDGGSAAILPFKEPETNKEYFFVVDGQNWSLRQTTTGTTPYLIEFDPAAGLKILGALVMPLVHNNRVADSSKLGGVAAASFLQAKGDLAAATDWNSLDIMGAYRVNNATGLNFPAGAYNYGMLSVIRSGDGVVQTYYPHNDTEAPWSRVRWSLSTASWTEWRQGGGGSLTEAQVRAIARRV